MAKSKLQKILEDSGFVISATANFVPMQVCGSKDKQTVLRNIYDSRTEVTINISREVYTDDDEEIIERYARVKIWLYRFSSCIAYIDEIDKTDEITDELDELISEIFNVSDATGWETDTALLSAINYIKGGNCNIKELFSDPNLDICYIHEFYIDPQYRGVGLSKYIFSLIPLILGECFGTYNGIITTYIAPYKIQGKLKNIDKNNNKYASNSGNPYVDSDEDTKMKQIMARPLIELGFEEVEKNHYATSIRNLAGKAEDNKIPVFFDGEYSSWMFSGKPFEKL